MILAIDVGKGTEDILVWDNKSTLENAIQIVVPSTAQLLAHRLSNFITKHPKETIYIHGELMAGEPWHLVIYKHAKERNGSVVMTETAAMSLRYNLDQVRSRGITIASDDEFRKVIQDVNPKSVFFTSDVNWERINHILIQSGIDIIGITAVLLTCQDHGRPEDPMRSTRDFRMKEIYHLLDENGNLEDLLFSSADVPNNLPRLQSIVSSALNNFLHLKKDNVFVMDSSPAVVLGVVDDKPFQTIINVGNGHTIVMILENSKVVIAYELHTGGVTPSELDNDINLLLQGKLSHQESLNRGGHGVYIRKQSSNLEIDREDICPFTLIGPNRSKLDSLNVVKAHPGGNMMMAGPIGLIKAYTYHRNKK